MTPTGSDEAMVLMPGGYPAKVARYFPRRPRPVHLALAAVVVTSACVAVFLGPALGALSLIAAVGAVIPWRDHRLIPSFVALLLPAGLVTPSLFGVTAPTLEVAVGAVGAGYALRLVRERRFPVEPATAALLAFLAFVAASGAGPTDTTEWLRRLAFWCALALVFHAGSRALSDESAVRWLVVALGTVAFFEAVLALVQFLPSWSERRLDAHGAVLAGSPNRPTGTLGHANALAIFLVLCLLPLVGLVARSSPVRRGALAVAAAAIVAAVGATLSRAAWIALAVGWAVFLLEARARRIVLAAGATVVVIASAVSVANPESFGRRLFSLASLQSLDPNGFRRQLWQRAESVIREHPLTGIGDFPRQLLLEDGKVVDEAVHPHNLLLDVAVTFGVLAAVAFVAWLVLAGVAAWAASRRSQPHELRPVATGTLAALVAAFVWGLFDSQLWNESLTTLIVLLAALAVGLGRSARRAGDET